MFYTIYFRLAEDESSRRDLSMHLVLQAGGGVQNEGRANVEIPFLHLIKGPER